MRLSSAAPKLCMASFKTCSTALLRMIARTSGFGPRLDQAADVASRRSIASEEVLRRAKGMMTDGRPSSMLRNRSFPLLRGSLMTSETSPRSCRRKGCSEVGSVLAHVPSFGEESEEEKRGGRKRGGPVKQKSQEGGKVRAAKVRERSILSADAV